MDLTTGYSISLPVYHALVQADGSFDIQGEIRGTAFSIGQGYMLTAAHVINGIPRTKVEAAVIGLYHPSLGFKGGLVTEVEFFALDVAVLKIRFDVPDSNSWFHTFKWKRQALNPFEIVRSVGYAYGIHRVDDKQMCVVRGFHGHIVSNLNEFKPVGMTGPAFAVYELSFLAPKGLSGAPLMNAQSAVVIHGIIIGNSESKMLVHRSEERLIENSCSSTIEQYETMQLGIAVQAGEILRLHSDLLGASFENHLSKNGLLVP